MLRDRARFRASVGIALLCACAVFGAACTDDAEFRRSVEDKPGDGDRRTDTDTTGDAGPGRSSPSSELDWEDCSDGECAELAVPLDYDDPDGETIDVAVFRIPAGDDDARIGSLLMNPGGPGASGVEFVQEAGSFLPGELTDRFDIVGFDPRGTGATVPVDCEGDDYSLDEALSPDYSPDSDEELAELEAAVQELVENCEAKNEGVLPYISSQDTVRDMDRIREALGDDQLTYAGFSYGTYLGALYATFFPDKVRALLLDGAVDPQLTSLESSLRQAAGFEQSLNAFLEDCAGDDSCSFHGGEDPRAAFLALSAAVDADPVPADDGRELGPSEFDIGVSQPLYGGAFRYGELADALADTEDGDATALFALYDEYTGRESDGSYDDLLEAFYAIGCIDAAPLAEPAQFPELEDEFVAAAPYFGMNFLYSGLICARWPVPPVEDPGPLRGEGAAPIVVVGTTGDPATPFEAAESLADLLRSGVLVTVEGTQHTSTFFALNSCVDELAVRYLVDLDVPEDGTRCD